MPSSTVTNDLADRDATNNDRRRLLRRGVTAIGAGLAAATMLDESAHAAPQVIEADTLNSTTGTTVINSAGTTGTAFAATASTSTGVMWGVAGSTNSDEGRGVDGSALSASGSTAGVWGRANSPDGTGVRGEAVAGIGGAFGGGRAALKLESTGPAPMTTAGSHGPGEIYLDEQQHLWLCVDAGTPGSWRRLTAPSTVPVEPFRIYDSRFADGSFVSGSNRVVAARDAIDVESGALVTSNAVPPGATAVFANLTITQTVSNGFLAAAPGDAIQLSASSTNWTRSGLTLANGILVSLDAQRRLKVFAGGPAGAASHVIIDVTGYIA